MMVGLVFEKKKPSLIEWLHQTFVLDCFDQISNLEQKDQDSGSYPGLRTRFRITIPVLVKFGSVLVWAIMGGF